MVNLFIQKTIKEMLFRLLNKCICYSSKLISWWTSWKNGYTHTLSWWSCCIATPKTHHAFKFLSISLTFSNLNILHFCLELAATAWQQKYLSIRQCCTFKSKKQTARHCHYWEWTPAAPCCQSKEFGTAKLWNLKETLVKWSILRWCLCKNILLL